MDSGQDHHSLAHDRLAAAAAALAVLPLAPTVAPVVALVVPPAVGAVRPDVRVWTGGSGRDLKS